MRILESLYLVPEIVDLFVAEIPYILKLRELVNEFAVLEDRHLELADLVVIDDLAFPYELRVEDLERLAVRNSVVSQCYDIAQSFVSILVEDSIDLLVARVCDLLSIFADLDLRDDLSSFSIADSL